jgi:hypothetical protein
MEAVLFCEEYMEFYETGKILKSLADEKGE